MKKPAKSRVFGFAGAIVIVAVLVTACTTTKENGKAAKPESLLETVEVQAGTFMFGRHGNE